MNPTVTITASLYDSLVAHVLPPDDYLEQVAFMYARRIERHGDPDGAARQLLEEDK